MQAARTHLCAFPPAAFVRLETSPVMSRARRRVTLLMSSSAPGGRAAMLATTRSRMRTTAGKPFLQCRTMGC